jgi:hypothetical protein
MSEVVAMRRRETGLQIASGLAFPLDAVTQTFLIVGKRGSGKSNTAARFVEQLHHARLPFVVLDPVDTWWGLKADRAGGRGLDVYVFGGRKADLPLEPGGGGLIAEVLCEHRLSMVLSVKHLSGRQRSDFMVAFAQTLFQRWAGGPLHVVLEEAHELAPQSAQTGKEGEQAMLGAFKRLWKLGRASGIGGTAVTQRPASLSKDITTQSEILIAHRTIGPQDVKAVGEWVKYHGEREDILAELPTLPTGEAFVWAPEFPEGKAIGLQRTSILLRDTFDSASTPKVGEQRVEPKELAPVDLERLRAKMSATIEKAKADDPKELRRQIADRDREIARLRSAAPAVPAEQRAHVPALTEHDRENLAKIRPMLEQMAGKLGVIEEEILGDAEDRLRKITDSLLVDARAAVVRSREQFLEQFEKASIKKLIDKIAALNAPQPHTLTTTSKEASGSGIRPAARISRPAPQAVQSGDLSKVERAFLTVLAQRDGKSTTRNQLAVFAGYSSKSRHVDNTISGLRVKGFVGGSSTALTMTEPGAAALGRFVALPSGADLREYWIANAGGAAEAAMLRVLFEAYPRALSRDELAEASNYSVTSRHVDNTISHLRTLDLVVGSKAELRASADLFE